MQMDQVYQKYKYVLYGPGDAAKNVARFMVRINLKAY